MKKPSSGASSAKAPGRPAADDAASSARSAASGTGSHASGAGRSRRPLVAALLLAVLVVGLLFVTVFPTRAYLAQRSAVGRAEQRIKSLDGESRRLDDESRRLDTPAEIERMAREQYGLVRPGESAYALLPPPAQPIGLPALWPFKGLDEALASH